MGAGFLSEERAKKLEHEVEFTLVTRLRIYGATASLPHMPLTHGA
jgi:hypothetical protein